MISVQGAVTWVDPYVVFCACGQASSCRAIALAPLDSKGNLFSTILLNLSFLFLLPYYRYKGGARPPPDIEAEGRRTKPCTNAVLHVRSAADADFDLDAPAIELKTDADGAFAVELEPGLYNVFRAAKYGKPAW